MWGDFDVKSQFNASHWGGLWRLVAQHSINRYDSDRLLWSQLLIRLEAIRSVRFWVPIQPCCSLVISQSNQSFPRFLWRWCGSANLSQHHLLKSVRHTNCAPNYPRRNNELTAPSKGRLQTSFTQWFTILLPRSQNPKQLKGQRAQANEARPWFLAYS